MKKKKYILYELDLTIFIKYHFFSKKKKKYFIYFVKIKNLKNNI